MTSKMHRMHFPKVGEGVIHIPGGVPYEAVPVAEALTRYVPGSFMRLGNKEFVYAIAGNTLNPDKGAMNLLQQAVAQNTIARTYAAGVTEIVVDIAATDGNDADGAFAKDELKGGEIVIWPHDENGFTRGIVSNTKTKGGGEVDEMTVVLDSPTPYALDINADHMEIIASPYSAVSESGGNDWAMVMGMPTVVATEGQGLWLQVGGPSWCAPQGVVGAAAGVLETVFRNDGSLEIRTVALDNMNQQHAGVVICTARGGGGQGAPFVMLQIAH